MRDSMKRRRLLPWQPLPQVTNQSQFLVYSLASSTDHGFANVYRASISLYREEAKESSLSWIHEAATIIDTNDQV